MDYLFLCGEVVRRPKTLELVHFSDIMGTAAGRGERMKESMFFLRSVILR